MKIGSIKFIFLAILLLSAFNISSSLAAQVKNPDEAEYLYSTFGDAVYQVQVIDLASNKKTSIGSGFQFSDKGFIATNYHVIAEALQRPENNRIEYLSDKGQAGALSVAAADVINDIAILKMDKAGKSVIALGDDNIFKGSKIFSIGNPHDIGFTIIEGTYNGIATDSLVDKVHFSGSLNPGMSGGPAINHEGKVIGINVATAGEQISFLVPVKHLSALWQKLNANPRGGSFIKDAKKNIQSQLLAYQNRIINSLLRDKWEGMDFGPVSVAGRINKAIKCWGGTNHQEKDSYKYFYSMCSNQGNIFLDNNFDTGIISYRYNHITGKRKMNLAQFYSFYEHEYAFPDGDFKNAGENDVTNFECNNSFLDIVGKKWKSSFCIRQYKKYPEIFDMHLYMASVGAEKSGFTATLVVQGVSKENSIKIADKFIREIKEKKNEQAVKAKGQKK